MRRADHGMCPGASRWLGRQESRIRLGLAGVPGLLMPHQHDQRPDRSDRQPHPHQRHERGPSGTRCRRRRRRSEHERRLGGMNLIAQRIERPEEHCIPDGALPASDARFEVAIKSLRLVRAERFERFANQQIITGRAVHEFSRLNRARL